MSLNLGEGREGRREKGRGEEGGSKTVFAQNRALQLSAINLIGLTIIYSAKPFNKVFVKSEIFFREGSHSEAISEPFREIKTFFKHLKGILISDKFSFQQSIICLVISTVLK